MAQAVRSGPRLARGCQTALELAQDTSKGVILNEIESLLLAFEVIVESRKRYPSCSANAPDGSALETSLGEDFSRVMKDVLQLGFGIARDRDTSGHICVERSFNKLYPSFTPCVKTASLPCVLPRLRNQQLRFLNPGSGLHHPRKHTGELGTRFVLPS